MLRSRIRSFAASLLHRSRIEKEINEEQAFHIQTRAEDLMQRDGLSREEAQRRARIEFGGAEKYREQNRAARGLRIVDELRQDVLYAKRILMRYPAFSLIAILSLALGIGANTFVFSVTSALLLRPLPVSSPDQLYSINRNGDPSESFPDYKDIRDRNSVFSSVFMYRIAPVALESGSGARRTWGYLVTGNYFETLGIQPAVGRFFTAEDDLHANSHAVLSFDSWMSQFGGNPGIVGQTVRINTRPFTVIGVAPRGFQGTEVFYWPELWLPLGLQAQIEGFPWLAHRSSQNGWINARLKPGITPQQANENLKLIAEQLAREYPQNNEGMRLSLSRPGLAGSMLRSPVRAFASGVMLLAGLVLLAACANIAILLSARLSDRSRELAIRLSIGADRTRIVRQLLTEAVVLALAGGAVGTAFAGLLLRLLSRWQAPLDFPIHFQVNPDLSVFVFAFLASLLTAIVFGVAPAFRAWTISLTAAMKGLAPTPSIRRWALRDVLLVVQIGVCCLLVTASVVAVRGLQHSINTPLGFQPEGVAVLSYDLGMAGYGRERGPEFQRRALETISLLPGATGAALANTIPLNLDQSSTTVYPEQTTEFRPRNSITAVYYYVSPGYFDVIGTRLLYGRQFTPQDAAGSAPVAIVNEDFARRVLGEGDWVGKRFTFGSGQPPIEVVGVVENGKYMTLTEGQRPAIFQPILQRYSPVALLMVRSSLPPAQMALEMRKAVAALDPHLPLYGGGDLTQMLRLLFLPANAAVISLGAFGVLATMLALTSIHGLASYSVAKRTREIGIRVAIGARPGDVVRLVFGRTGFLVAIGAIVGMAAGVLGSKLLAGIVLGVSARDPLVFALTALTMMITGVAAAWKPLRRAVRVPPVIALKSE